MIRMKNQLSKLRFLFFNCISICNLFFCVALSAQSNQIDPIQKSSLSLKGLLSKVEVLRDQWGINHIYAQNEHDLFFAQITILIDFIETNHKLLSVSKLNEIV